MNQLQHELNKILDANQFMNIAQFMETVVPYYYANNIAFGKDGDFITAPQISQLFGEILALWVINHCITHQIAQFNLIELGPGMGTLMHDVLRTIKQFPDIYSSLGTVHLVEGSERLQKIQKSTLHNLHQNIKWHNNLESVAELCKASDKPTDSLQSGAANIIIANEFFDCLPVRQFIRTKHDISEIMIQKSQNFGQDNGLNLEFTIRPADFQPKIELEINEIYEQNINYNYYCGLIKDIMNQSNNGGLSRALIIDYGYVERCIKSTLQALYRHKYHDPLKNIGDADLTALVNFTELESIFESFGLNTHLRLQGDFLYEYGIVARCSDLYDRTGVDLTDQLERLTDKKQMGALFKVLEIY